MSKKFWELMDRVFLLLIDITGETDGNLPSTLQHFPSKQNNIPNGNGHL